MIAILLDTDVLIEVFRRRDEKIAAQWADLSDREAMLLYSPVTEAEIFHGIEDHERPDVVEGLEAMTCIDIDSHVGRTAGNYLRLYNRSHNLQLPDALIAATASVHQVRLWTRNRKHFPMKDVHFFG